MADGDLASIFRQRTQPVSDPWGLTVPQHQLSHLQQIPQSVQDADNVRWDYPNSLSPQSPFDIQDYNSNFSNRMLQSKVGSYNHSYSSLRPSALPPQSQLHFPTIAPQLVESTQVLQPQTLAGNKRDYHESSFQLQRKQPTPSVGRNIYSEVVPRTSPVGQENLVTATHHQSQFAGYNYDISNVLSTWPTVPTDCEVTTESQSEILGDLRPGPGYLADHYPGRLLQSGQAFNENQNLGPQGNPNDWPSGSGTLSTLQQNFSGGDGMIKVLDTACSRRNQQTSANGLQLVHLLLVCAEAISNQQMDLAHVVLTRLNAMLVPCTSTMQRLGAVFVDALHARITNSATTGRYKGLERDKDVAILDMLQSFSVIYDHTPFIKLPHLTLNQIILDAVEGEHHVHLIDLNTGWRGMQWPAFIQALALRPGGPPKLRITSIGKADDLEHSREKLQDYALHLQVPFEFCPIVVDMKSFDVRLLDMRSWEVVCINSANQFHQLLIWGDERFHKFLCDLKSLNPRVLAFTENDADHNSPEFLNRFFECLRYYSAVYDALEASLPSGSTALQQIEHLFTGQKIRNIVAMEGEDRITRHESLTSWSRRMEMAGFRSVPVSSRAISQAGLLLRLYFAQSGYTLRTENGNVSLGWDNMSLVGASAWRA